jgi:hypothetical protein
MTQALLQCSGTALGSVVSTSKSQCAVKDLCNRGQLVRLQGKLIHRRTVNLRREHEHRCRVDETFERQEQRAGSLQTRLLSLRNRGGESFDIINLNYDNTDAGRALQEKVCLASWMHNTRRESALK